MKPQRNKVLSLASGLLVAVLVWALILVPEPAIASNCTDSTIGLSPLTDLGSGSYLGYQGGLYPGGANRPPEAYSTAGVAAASRVQPRLSDGTVAAEGLIGLISIGVSNTKIEFDAFEKLVLLTPGISPSIVLVNGAQGARALDQWASGPNSNPWVNLDTDVLRAGLSPEQVQVAWIKLPDKSRGTIDLEQDAPIEIDRLNNVIDILTDRYPNLQLAYLSSRIYAGYSDGSDSEPKAYQSGFTIKWLIEQRIEAGVDGGEGKGPWVGWGPYLWADGLSQRSDGLVYECSDMDEDGIHPGPRAADKVAALLLAHFLGDPTATPWFQHAGDQSAPTTTAVVTGVSGATDRPTTTTTLAAGPGGVETTSTTLDQNLQVPGSGTFPSIVVVGVGAAAFLAAFAASSAWLGAHRRRRSRE